MNYEKSRLVALRGNFKFAAIKRIKSVLKNENFKLTFVSLKFSSSFKHNSADSQLLITKLYKGLSL